MIAISPLLLYIHSAMTRSRLITQKAVTIYGIAGIAVMVILLSLLWFKVVPRSLYVPVFLMALAVFAGRLVLRILLLRQERADRQQSSR